MFPLFLEVTMSLSVNVLFGFLFGISVLIGIYRAKASSAERKEVAKKLVAAVEVNVKLKEVFAQNEALRVQMLRQKEELSSSHMREATYRVLSVDELGDLLLLARHLSIDRTMEGVCDIVLLGCLSILERHIVLRREGHSDVRAALACFEKGDLEQLKCMFVGLKARRPKDFAAIADRFPRRVDRFFRRLMDEELTAEVPIEVAP